MHIKIKGRLAPFTHSPGNAIPIPHTQWEVKIFPARLFFTSFSTGEREELSLPIEGPVKGFTVLLDLHRAKIEVYGYAKGGYFRYTIAEETLSFKKGKSIALPFLKTKKGLSFEEFLFMGVHKKADWDLVTRRNDLREIFPFWIALSQLLPEEGKFPLVGNYRLIGDVSEYSTLLKTGFSGILSPRVQDETYSGVLPDEEIPKGLSALPLIHEGARQIRKLFFFEGKQGMHILPDLSKEFHAGKYLSLTTSKGDVIDIEWSKKQIRRMVIRPGETREERFYFQKGIRSCRISGERADASAIVSLKQGKRLLFDRFEK